MLQTLFEGWVSTACLPTDVAHGANSETDAKLRASAAEARARRFLRGRACARLALQRLGPLPSGAARIGADAEGLPVWPAGVVGAISHTATVSVAVVARASDASAIGVDVEANTLATPAFAARVCAESELDRIRQLGATPEELAPVIFSAKEAVQKLQFPLSREGVGLRRVEILLEEQHFTARFKVALPPFPEGTVLQGRWSRVAGVLIGTATWLRAHAPS